MRYLRWVGLVPSLLIGGLLVAPVYSEASGTLIQIQSGPNSVGGAPVQYGALATIPFTTSSCPSTSYTRCFALTLGTYAGVTVANAPGATAKLLIGDKTGAGGSLDVFTLSGVKFTPTSANRTVKVIYKHKFDDAPNAGGGAYSYGMQTGGFLQASDGSNVNDFLKLSGSANLGSSTAFPPDLTVSVGGAPTTTTTFSRQNQPTYAASSCSTPCTPTITHTLTFVVIGTDSVNLTNSLDGGGTDCNLNPQGPPGGNPARPCHGGNGNNSVENQINAFLTAQANADAQTAPPDGVPFVPCVEYCTQDPDIINPGTITINKNICSYGYCAELPPQTFTFIITGPTSTTVTVETGGDGTVSYNVGGLSPGTYDIVEIAKLHWELHESSCGYGGSTLGVQVDSAATVSCHFENRSINHDD